MDDNDTITLEPLKVSARLTIRHLSCAMMKVGAYDSFVDDYCKMRNCCRRDFIKAYTSQLTIRGLGGFFHGTVLSNCIVLPTSMMRGVTSSFNWASSPHGLDYWKNIYNKLLDWESQLKYNKIEAPLAIKFNRRWKRLR